MPSNDIPNQYNLPGENTPMWLVLGLLLVGTIGSVTTARLLLPPGLTMETLKSWIIPSNFKQRASQPSLPIIRTIDISTVTTPQSPKAEPARPSVEESDSRHKSSEEKHGVTSTPLPTTIDRPVTTESTVASVEQKGFVVDESPIAEGSEGERELSLYSPELPVEPTSPTSDEIIAEQPKVESDEPRIAETTEGERESSVMPTASLASSAGTVADFAANKVIETTAQARVKSAADADKTRNCVPLFSVQFERDSTHPIDLDLSAKVTKLREWLSLHPEAKLQVEGHTDSYGPEDFNLLISHRRAKAVFKLLASAGVTNKQMVTRAFGEYSPLAGFPPESERNRRVSLRVVGARACPKAESDGEIR